MSAYHPLKPALARVQAGDATAEDLEKLRSFVQNASQALEDAQVRQLYDISIQVIIQSLDMLFQEVRQRSAELEAVRKASLSLTASLDLNEVLDTILENTLGLLNEVQDAHIFLYEDGRLNLRLRYGLTGAKDNPGQILVLMA